MLALPLALGLGQAAVDIVSPVSGHVHGPVLWLGSGPVAHAHAHGAEGALAGHAHGASGDREADGGCADHGSSAHETPWHEHEPLSPPEPVVLGAGQRLGLPVARGVDVSCAVAGDCAGVQARAGWRGVPERVPDARAGPRAVRTVILLI